VKSCQDISIAGKGAGITGERSGLWFEYWRIIRDLRPRFAIMENVGALTFRGLDAVLGSLSEIGYNAEWQDIRASDMGAPHKRERIWIITYPDTASIGRSTGRNYERQHTDNIFEIRETEENQQSGNIGKCGACEICTVNVADTERQQYVSCEHERQSRCQKGAPERYCKTVSNADPERCEEQHNRITERPGNFDGCDDRRKAEHPGWSTEPAVGRLVNGLPGRVDRLKGLGNSIVPQIAELLFNQIKPLL